MVVREAPVSASTPLMAVLVGFADVVRMMGAAALWLAIVGGIVVVTGAAEVVMGAAVVVAGAALLVIGAAAVELAETGTGLGAVSWIWTIAGADVETGTPIAWTDPEEGDAETAGAPDPAATAVADAEADFAVEAEADAGVEAEGPAGVLAAGLLDAALAEALGAVLAEAEAETEAEAEADAAADACGQLRLVSEAVNRAVRKSKRF